MSRRHQTNSMLRTMDEGYKVIAPARRKDRPRSPPFWQIPAAMSEALSLVRTRKSATLGGGHEARSRRAEPRRHAEHGAAHGTRSRRVWPRNSSCCRRFGDDARGVENLCGGRAMKAGWGVEDHATSVAPTSARKKPLPAHDPRPRPLFTSLLLTPVACRRSRTHTIHKIPAENTQRPHDSSSAPARAQPRWRGPLRGPGTAPLEGVVVTRYGYAGPCDA